MSRLKIRFDEPEHGWIGLFVEYAGQVRQYNSSYVSADSFAQLVTALLSLTDYQGCYEVEWYCNPDQLRLTFTREADQISLVVAHHSDQHNGLNQVEGWFFASGTYDEICLPFWRALRRLQSLYSEAEWKRRYQRSFPTCELDLLTRMLGKA